MVSFLSLSREPKIFSNWFKVPIESLGGLYQTTIVKGLLRNGRISIHINSNVRLGKSFLSR